MPANDFPLVAVLLGWPAVAVSIFLVAVGIVRGQAQVALPGAVLGCPFLLYLFASPRVGWVSLLAGVLYLGSSRAVAQSRRGLAIAMATPFVVLTGFVAWAVTNQ